MTPERLARVDQVLARRQPDLTVLAENLDKPRNFSAIIRSCDAVGIWRVNLVPGEARPRRHWHTSSGSEKWVERRDFDSIEAAVDRLRSEGFSILAAHLSPAARDFRSMDYTRPTALMFGTELFGVSDRALQLADAQIHIPMEGMTQSLNVSVACALVLYEAQRQREAAGMYDDPRLAEEVRVRLRFEWLHPKVAAFCRGRGLAYPPLREDGEISGPLPGDSELTSPP
ncbi:MAG: tRNA (guanosine(18)-2'-O)-methyltransferase TrmH [Xanthomonadales bacterium]|nr:tRNA (guanosine(18)-2'-O)-methyltransferase TrmH [Xanthomonadales bacterium]